MLFREFFKSKIYFIGLDDFFGFLRIFSKFFETILIRFFKKKNKNIKGPLVVADLADTPLGTPRCRQRDVLLDNGQLSRL